MHILNLIVQEGLKEIDLIIQNIRDAIRYTKNSTNRINKFRKIVGKLEFSTSKGLPLDVSTRWNSTYLMLELAIYFREAFLDWDY